MSKERLDILSPKERSQRMGLIKSKNTKLELRVRQIARDLGFKYCLHVKNLPGVPDIVFREQKKAVFVHGCFWHRHSAASCRLARMPKSKLAYWKPKLERNRKRDVSNQRKLREMGWSVLTIWECSLRKRPGAVKKRLEAFLAN